ncbi:hypothetical protein Fot_38757 [Forsythia ovata]|uniref:Uncharacterized protein n=1 Tax=Forsythia ovata TaxID=205694 RepID=A0ABD1S2S1_9LAMI
MDGNSSKLSQTFPQAAFRLIWYVDENHGPNNPGHGNMRIFAQDVYHCRICSDKCSISIRRYHGTTPALQPKSSCLHVSLIAKVFHCHTRWEKSNERENPKKCLVS